MAKQIVEAQVLPANIRNNKEVVKGVIDITEMNKQVDILEREIQMHELEIQRIARILRERQAEREQLVFSAAVLIDQLRNQNEGGRANLNEIFIDGEPENGGQNQRRIALGEVISMLKFTYIVDPLSNLTQVHRGIVMNVTPNWPDQENPDRANN